MKEAKDTGYQAVIWNEPLLQELSVPGRRGSMITQASDEIKKQVGDVVSKIPSKMLRENPPALPEISEPLQNRKCRLPAQFPYHQVHYLPLKSWTTPLPVYRHCFYP